MNTGIPIIDSVLEIFPWNNSEEYKKIIKIYSRKNQQVNDNAIIIRLQVFHRR
ncbi:MAG: hypothetical protein HUU50_17610 [Candidatus Brocadiae bacterium]|nr:hypothetical protein [Candidatus Brocadiia bacterium]